ncbi:ROK family protein [Tatumella sp. UCD-D_suzukii]|uniref:ROK family protein n=1 Tax=Tatumella sp. UCD-D_suzukii TaxID=1408192 RepID=UPI00046FFCE6|nr:ROK family protein [Tatumella sp. UCD-D_suzukii]
MNKAVMCFDVGGSFIKSAVYNGDNSLTEMGKVPMPAEDWPAFCQALQQLLNAAAPRLADDSPVAVSAAGVVDPRTDTILAGNIPAFRGRTVARELSVFLQRQVVIANDADCFTLAEASADAGDSPSILLGIILGSGVGGGLVINQQIISGAGGLTGEWGHGPITRTEFDYQGQTLHLPRLRCGCGQYGCLDTLGGARGLERLYLHLLGRSADSRTIIEQWQNHSADALKVVTLWSQLVSEVLAVVVNTLGPDRIVAGGGLASVPELMSLLDEELRSRILRPCHGPLITRARYQQQGGLVGAGRLARGLT